MKTHPSSSSSILLLLLLLRKLIQQIDKLMKSIGNIQKSDAEVNWEKSKEKG